MCSRDSASFQSIYFLRNSSILFCFQQSEVIRTCFLSNYYCLSLKILFLKADEIWCSGSLQSCLLPSEACFPQKGLTAWKFKVGPMWNFNIKQAVILCTVSLFWKPLLSTTNKAKMQKVCIKLSIWHLEYGKRLRWSKGTKTSVLCQSPGHPALTAQQIKKEEPQEFQLPLL